MKCHGYPNGCVCPRCLHRAQSYNTRGVARKEVRQFINAMLTPNGWTRVDTDSAGHLRFWHPEQQGRRLLSVPQTPSDHRWRLNTLRDARRIWPGQPTLRTDRSPRAPPSPERPAERVTPPATPAPSSERVMTPVARVTPRYRAERLQEYARARGIGLTREQASALLEREGTLTRARAFLDRLAAAAAKRAQDADAA